MSEMMGKLPTRPASWSDRRCGFTRLSTPARLSPSFHSQKRAYPRDIFPRTLDCQDKSKTVSKMPSASKQKRLAEKAAKNAGKVSMTTSPSGTPDPSTNGNSTPMTSLSANGSEENLADAHEAMKKLNLATDRSAVRPSCIPKVDGGRADGVW